LLGPSTITSKANYIYTEKGFYDTKRNKAHFLNKSYIKYNDRVIRGDSLYYDRTKEFASALLKDIMPKCIRKRTPFL
jgi:lipopolysaccharide export system protein LptA